MMSATTRILVLDFHHPPLARLAEVHNGPKKGYDLW